MNKLARNTLALGTATMIVTAGISFSASAKDVKTYTSYSEAQFIASSGPLLGTALVDPLGDALENSGVRSSVPTSLAGKTGEQYVSGPLDPLKALTQPVGNALAAKIGAAGSYANTKDDFAAAASGAVTNRGLVDVGSSSAPPSNATLDLTGPSSGLSALNGVTNVQLDTGAVASTASIKDSTSQAQRGYKLAGGTLSLEIAALKNLNTALGGVTGPTGSLSTLLAPDLTLNASNVCKLLISSGSTLLAGLTLPIGAALPTDQAGCDLLTTLNLLGELKITGLDTVTTGLQDLTDDGVTLDFSTGKITIDIAKAFKALDAQKRDINNLPANTDILGVILPGIVANIDDLVAKIKTDLVDQLTSKLKVEGTLIGLPIPALSLQQLRDAGLGTVVDGLFAGLDTVLKPISDTLAPALTTLITQIQPVAKITVNVPDTYSTLVAPRLKKDGVTAAATKTTSAIASETALRVQLLTVGGNASALDILLGNSLVGPTSATTTQVDDAVGNTDQNAEEPPVNNDDNDSVADGTDANADTVADADAQADADVTTSLPSTGAPNLLPFWLLGIALLLFGGAVLLNEKRRLNQI